MALNNLLMRGTGFCHKRSATNAVLRRTMSTTMRINRTGILSSKTLYNISRRNALTKIESIKQFEQFVNESVKLLVIDYKAEWCGPCKQMAPFFKQLSEQYDEECDFLVVDCDELPELAAQRGVASLPTFELISNGSALDQIIGANPTKLESQIVKHLEDK